MPLMMMANIIRLIKVLKDICRNRVITVSHQRLSAPNRRVAGRLGEMTRPCSALAPKDVRDCDEPDESESRPDDGGDEADDLSGSDDAEESGGLEVERE